ncbi:hypothetical protein [Rubrivirga sp. IMCC43871]|uniref:hypothetical protein n=1 Tax=Rubrivirga sp. IMCC43871 TaxID=3391575 RepID=UPI0039902791
MHPIFRSTLLGAFLGSVAVAGAFGLLVLAGLVDEAPFVGAWQSVFGGGWVVASVLGGAAFLAIGTLWGVPFTLVPRPTVGAAMLYAILPTLWALVGWPSLLGRPTFAGGDSAVVMLTVMMNVGVWGGILGAYAHRHTTAEGRHQASLRRRKA